MIHGRTSHDVGINKAIVGVLRNYDKEIPVDYLAKELCRSTSEIQRPLQNLEKKGIVKIHDAHISVRKF